MAILLINLSGMLVNKRPLYIDRHYRIEGRVLNLKAIIINGGYSVDSRLTGVQLEIEKLLNQHEVSYEKIIVHRLPAQDLITANFASPTIIEHVKKVEKSEIVILLTPVFKGAYSGILKTFIDLLPQKGLEGKSVIPVALGGSIAHLLSIEYALKPIISILGSTHVTNPVYVVDKQIAKIDGNFTVESEVVDRLENSLKQAIVLEAIKA